MTVSANDPAALRMRERTACDDAGQNVGDESVGLRRRDQVAERLPAAPDVIDHRMIGVSGGIDIVDIRVLTKIAGQIERELHAGRGSRLRFVDRDLEKIRSSLMATDEPARARDAAMRQRRDFETA